MKRSRITFFGLGFLAVLLMGAYLVDQRYSPANVDHRKLEQVIESYRTRGLLAYTGSGIVGYDIAYLQSCLDLLDKKYGKRIESVNINGPINPNAINIYLFKQDPEKALSDFKGNCAYTGHKNIIICDFSYVAEWQRLHESVDASEFVWASEEYKAEYQDTAIQATRAMRANFILWLLGHEIGHIAHHHIKRHYAFNSEENSTVLINNFDGRWSQEEEEADEFMVDAMAGDNIGFMYLTLSQVIREFEKRHRQEQNLPADFIDTDKKLVLRSHSRTHPPFLLRAVNVFLLFNKKHHVESAAEGKLPFERLKDHLTVERQVEP